LLTPSLLAGREFELPMPLDQHLSGALTPRNLLAFWVLLYARLHLHARNGARSWGERFLLRAPAGTRLLLLFALLFLVYLNAAAPRRWPSGDTIPGKFIPISLLTEGRLDLGAYAGGVPHARRYGFWEVDGKTYAAYPVAPSLTVLPVYGLVHLAFPGALDEVKEIYAAPGADDTVNLANTLEHVAAASVTALAVVLFVVLVRDRCLDRRFAWLLALALGLGTSLMSTAALALWQHGPACLALTVMLLALARADTVAGRGGHGGDAAGTAGANRWGLDRFLHGSAWLILAGLAAGWAYACRPSLLVVPPLAALWAMRNFRLKSVWFLLPCGLVGLSVFAYNYAVFGKLTGGYARNLGIFASWDGMAVVTLLFSPSRGLFLFSPFLLFTVAGLAHALRRPWRMDGLCTYLNLATLTLFSFWSTWAAGSSFGARYLCEATLLMVVVLGWQGAGCLRRRWVMEIFLLLVIASCHLHIVGAREGDAGWTEHVFKPDDIAAAWSWRDSQVVYTLFRGPP
jgi:hypothetical protein